MMRIAVGADDRTPLTEAVLQDLKERGYELELFGHVADDPIYWPEVARQVGEAVAFGSADEAVLLCWTGTGISMAANKIPGIRAALCADGETAKGARLWNDANALCLSLRLTSIPVAREILDSWFSTQYQPNPEDDACLTQLKGIEGKFLTQAETTG